MIGIIGWGAYIPRTRLTGAQLAEAWGGSQKGGVSVADHDEDSLTMASEAALDCMEGKDPLMVDRLYFASTTAPYLEHQNAAMVAAVADLRHDVMAADFGGSVRSSSSALRAAYDAVRADEAEHVMVCAADARMASPGDPMERAMGAGAAALIVGRGKPYAVIKQFHSTTRVFMDHWRMEGDSYVQSGDAKFINDKGINSHLPEIVDEFLEAADVARQEIASVVYYAPALGNRRGLDKKLGFPEKAYPADNPQAAIGNTGSAQVFLGLGAALDNAKPGDLILVINHGSGADACLLEVTEHVGEFKSGIKEQIEMGRPVKSYAKYLKAKKILPGEQLNIWASSPVLWREEKVNVRRLGNKCVKCGRVNYPPQYKCRSCGGEEMKTHRISRRGKIFTFTLDSLVPNPDPPTPMVSVDLEGGGRLYAQMTEVDPQTVEIGQEVEMVFRKLHQGGGYNNYFWKFRPVKG